MLFLTIILMVSTSSAYSQVVINEYSCSNLSQFMDNYSKYEDWIELYNTGNTSVNMAGYYLSDDSVSNMKWQFPAGITIASHGFLRIWASGRDEVIGNSIHTNFKLTQTKNNHEFIVLSDPAGTFLDYVVLSRKTQLGHSLGRSQNGLNQWSLFTNPTPNASNNTATPFLRYADKPNVSLPAGYYTGTISLALTTSELNADIHYTLDGKAPTINSPIYVYPLTITATTVVKATTFSADPEILPSFTQFDTYFINVSHTTVVVSISGTDVDVLANGNSTIEPHGTFEYFNLQQERTAKTYGEFDKHGQDSWANSQRSLDFIARDEMGYKYTIDEQMFNWTSRNKFQRVILRAAGDDNYPADHHPANAGSAHMRDAYVHSLANIGGMDLDVRISEKCIVYLNGQYWGVYDIRERPDDSDFTDYYYGQDKYHLYYILLWGNTWAEYGGPEALADWNVLYNYIMSNNMADQDKFNYVADRYDYKSLVDYVITNEMTVCSDWLNWNVGIWRGIDSTGGHLKWGYILWDNDATFGFYINYTGIPNTSPNANPCDAEALSGSSDPDGHIIILNRLKQNPEFYRYYVTRQIDLWNTVFSQQNMISQLDSTENIIDPEMTMHAQRWFGTYTEWKSNVQQLRNYIIQRTNYLPTGLINCYSLNGPHQVVVQVDPPGTGYVFWNSLSLYYYPWSGTYFGGIDNKLVALANPSYVFDHWSSTSQTFLPNNTSDSATVNLVSSDTIVAHFSLYTSVTQPTTKNPSITATLYPSLVNKKTILDYYIPSACPVSIKLFSTLGNEIASLDEFRYIQPGPHQLSIDLSSYNLMPGMYLLRFQADNYQKTLKLIYSPR